jgi:hypothetical protein
LSYCSQSGSHEWSVANRSIEWLNSNTPPPSHLSLRLYQFAQYLRIIAQPDITDIAIACRQEFAASITPVGRGVCAVI